MQSVENFMQEYFRAKTAEIKRELEQRVPFRKKYFASNCAWDSRKGATENSEAESILEIVKFETKAAVITEPTKPFPKQRYHLQRVDEGWIILSVDIACLICEGVVGNSCQPCEGTGWMNLSKRSEEIMKSFQKMKSEISSFKRNVPPRSDQRF